MMYVCAKLVDTLIYSVSPMQLFITVNVITLPVFV